MVIDPLILPSWFLKIPRKIPKKFTRPNIRKIAYLIVLQLFLPTLIGAENIPNQVFYRNTGINIEIRILLEGQEKTAWVLVQNRDGLPQKVSKEIVIRNDDILGFTTDDYTPDFDDDKGFKIHFEPDAWKRIRETTSRLKGKRIALIREGKIYWSPTMLEAITRSAVMSFTGEETSVEEFLKDFPTEDIPEHLHSETLHEKFLTDWIESRPEDLGALQELVNHYFEDKNHPKVNKALPYVQRLVKITPDDFMNQKRLMQCYSGVGNHEKALATGIQALSHIPTTEKMLLHFIVGNLQYEMGNKTDAIKSLEASLEIIRQIKIPSKNDIDRRFLSETSLQELDELVVPKKEDMIQEVNDRINFIMAH